MTDQEAYRLIEDAIRLIRDSASWGQITVDISKGVVRHVNITTSLSPSKENPPRDDSADF